MEAETGFQLETICPAWKGCRIIALKHPLLNGLSIVRARLADARFALFNLITEFDYDGPMEKVTFLEGYPDQKSATDAAAQLMADGVSETLTEREGWRILYQGALPREVLPATLSVLPGSFPPQYAAHKLGDGTPYNSLYYRTYLIARQPDCDLADQILAYDGIAEVIVDYLSRVGGFRWAHERL